METAFGASMENMAMLYHSIVGERLAINDLEAGNLTPKEVRHRGDVILECRDVFAQAFNFPGVGEA
jgi:hypothetical protein